MAAVSKDHDHVDRPTAATGRVDEVEAGHAKALTAGISTTRKTHVITLPARR
jgi:hypothetical protein